ncbi:MAG TPA: hypothetical protein VGI55_15790 [Solirubrobacteraceae bacterium]
MDATSGPLNDYDPDPDLHLRFYSTRQRHLLSKHQLTPADSHHVIGSTNHQTGQA